jgi:hypothetical protein
MRNPSMVAIMMGSRSWKGGDECDALAHRFRRRVHMPARIIRAAKRSFWKRTRKTVRATVRQMVEET